MIYHLTVFLSESEEAVSSSTCHGLIEPDAL